MKLILVDNSSKMLLNFRKEFIRKLAKTVDVYVLCPLNEEDKVELISLGVKQCFDNTYLRRQGINPIHDYKLFRFYQQCFHDVCPDIVFNYTIKCTIWASLAAKRSGVKSIFSMITGLGYAFTDVTQGGLKKRLVNYFVKKLYKKSLTHNKKVFFLNNDDSQLFGSLGITSLSQSVVLNGEGVDLDYFYYVDNMPEKLSIIMLSRLLKDKGILEYYKAAKILKSRYGDQLSFKLAGSIDNNPTSLSQSDLNEIIESGCVDYLGSLSDVREAIKSSSVLLLPSYREGTPRCILEAMSMGRAIITTDAPGCRETVIDGENGFLISVKSVNEIVDSVEKLLKDQNLLVSMGKCSRRIAENKYDAHKVNRHILNEIIQGFSHV